MNHPGPSSPESFSVHDDDLTAADLDRLRTDMAILPLLRVIAENSSVTDSRLDALPAEVAQNLTVFPEIGIHGQARLINDLEAAGNDPVSFLRAAALRRKIHDPAFAQARLDSKFIDPEVSAFNRGHQVELIVEIPENGTSRHQSGFYEDLLEHARAGQVVGVNASPNELELLTRMERDPDEPLTKHALRSALLNAFMRDPESSLFVTDPTETEMMLLAKMPSGYSYEFMRGMVAEPPGNRNDGMLRFDNGRQVEQANIRLGMIVGADTNVLLARGEKEPYYGRRVRVWWEGTGSWMTGRIVEVTTTYGMRVKTDEPVRRNSSGAFSDGLTINPLSPDVDFRDPETTDEIQHPLEQYKAVRRNNLLLFDDPLAHIPRLGIIRDYHSANQEMRLEVAGWDARMRTLKFDAKYRMLDDGTVSWELADGTIARRGARFSLPPRRLGEKPRVYEIIGVDAEQLENGRVFARCSNRQKGAPLYEEVFFGNLKQVASAEDIRTCLEAIPGYNIDRPEYATGALFNYQGRILSGKVLTFDTIPFHVEIIIKKAPNEIERKGPSTDFYHRFIVRPEDIVEMIDVPV